MSSIDPLCCSPGRELLAQWEENEEYRHLSPMELSLAIRAQTDDPATASAIASQLQLRTQAEGKFGSLARTMLWTRDGYEQATRWVLAREHAARFVKAGATHIGDLGCGIGADSLAFARAGMRVTSYDINDEAVSAARENLSSFPSARVEKRDVSTLGPEDFEAEGFDALFADPARRTGKQGGSKRISSPSDWSPSLDRVLSWAQHVPRLGVKVAPGIPYELIPSQFHARWTSVDGDLLEAALWSPSLASEGAGRSACVITRDEVHTLEDPQIASADSPARQAVVGQLGSYLYEPDSAVIRAGMVARLSEDLDAHLISESIAYLSASQLIPTPFAAAFEVIDQVNLRAKNIQQALRAHDIGRVEVKKRGADIQPDALRKSLKLTGSQAGVVIATRIGQSHRAIIARRISAGEA